VAGWRGWTVFVLTRTSWHRSFGDGSNNTNLADSAAVIVASSATLHLKYSDANSVNALSFAGMARHLGVYSVANSRSITGPVTDYTTWTTFHHITGGQCGDDSNSLTN
jgi:hypothetical protein